MNIRDLKYLLSVAKHKHFGKAAQECFVSQPALSMQLKKLEEELGVKLFERSNKKVFVTDVGKTLIEKAGNIIQTAQDMKDIAKNFQDPLSGEIKIGAFPTLAPYFLPQIVPKISKKLPNLKLLLIEEKTDILIGKLKEGSIDAAFLALPIEDDELKTCELFDDEFYLAVYPDHELSAKQNISYNDLRDQSLLLLEDGHCLRNQALDVCSLAGTREDQEFRATSLETLRQMVAANVGITLIPKIARKDNDNLIYIPFKDNQPVRKIALVWRKTSTREQCLEFIARL